MRKLIALLAIMASTIGLGIAGAAPASAANCQTTISNTFWNGHLNFIGGLVCDSGVDKVQYLDGYAGRWYDYTLGGYIDSYDNGGDGPGIEPSQIQTNNGANQRTYSTIAWCFGATHRVSNEFQFKIHNTANGGSWGPPHYVSTQQYNIVC